MANKSKYTGEAPKKFRAIKTIGQLRKAIQDIPDKVPLEGHFGGVATLSWFNVGIDTGREHIAFDEVDE